MRANTFAVKTMNGLWVMPKIAGIESSAKITSVVPIAMRTMSRGVKKALPSMRVRIFMPSYSSVIGMRLRRNPMSLLSRASSSSRPLKACCAAVTSRNAPKM